MLLFLLLLLFVVWGLLTIDYSPAGGGTVELVREVGAVKLGVAALGEVDAGSVVASG